MHNINCRKIMATFFIAILFSTEASASSVDPLKGVVLEAAPGRAEALRCYDTLSATVAAQTVGEARGQFYNDEDSSLFTLRALTFAAAWKAYYQINMSRTPSSKAPFNSSELHEFSKLTNTYSNDVVEHGANIINSLGISTVQKQLQGCLLRFTPAKSGMKVGYRYNIDPSTGKSKLSGQTYEELY